MTEDAALLRRYAREHSESAFAELVGRYAGLVYSAGLRRVHGDAHTAEDVTQRVFASLARNAEKLAEHPALPAWLHAATRNAAVEALRREDRRRRREVAAHQMQLTDKTASTEDWGAVRPFIDEALDELEHTDRTAVILRFFEKRPFADIGVAINLTADAARMRTDRALEALRVSLEKRGITSTGAALGLMLGEKAVAGAPASVVAAIAGSAGSVGQIAAGIMMTKKSLLAAVVIIAACGTATYHWNTPRNAKASAAAVTEQLKGVPIRQKTGDELSAPTVEPGQFRSAAQRKVVADQSAADVAAKRAAPQSKFAKGEWTNERELCPSGLSSPLSAYETLLYSATSGDVAGTASTLFITEEARKRAEKLLANLPAEKRREYPNAEILFASIYIGASALSGKQPGVVSYKFETVEPGIAMTPLALGLAESAATDVAYQTIKSKARTANSKESDPEAVFFKTDDGWKWVVPPSMFDAFGRLLKAPSPTGKN